MFGKYAQEELRQLEVEEHFRLQDRKDGLERHVPKKSDWIPLSHVCMRDDFLSRNTGNIPGHGERFNPRAIPYAAVYCLYHQALHFGAIGGLLYPFFK